MYTLKCISDFKENTQVTVTEHTEIFLKELAADKLRLLYCEQRMAHKSVELAKKEEEIGNLRRALQASKEDHKDMPEVLLKLANLFKDGDVDTKFIETFLNDLVNSYGKGRKTWSSTTKSLFAMLLDYGGPMVCELVAKNFGGPSVSSVYREARSEKAVSESLASDSFKDAKVFYEKLGYKCLFSLAVDATAIAQMVRCRGNRIIGYATNEDVRVNSAQDIIDCVKEQKYEKACQAYAFILVSLQPSIPSFTLAIQPVIKGETADTVDTWMRNSRAWAGECGMNLLGLGADGDSKIHKYFHMRCHGAGNKKHGLSVGAPDFTFFAPLEKIVTVAVLKELLKDKGIAFSSKAKKSDLVKIFNNQTCTLHITIDQCHGHT